MNFGSFALRDVGIMCAALIAWHAAQSAPAPMWLSLLVTLLSLLVCIAAHEWGHLLGARCARAVIYPKAKLGSPFIFAFDVDRNSRAQFLAMGVGAYLSTLLSAALIMTLVPPAPLHGQLLRSLVPLGLAVLLLDDLPTFIRVARGRPMPRGGLYADATTHPGEPR